MDGYVRLFLTTTILETQNHALSWLVPSYHLMPKRKENIWVSWDSNLDGAAPYADTLSITPWPQLSKWRFFNYLFPKTVRIFLHCYRWHCLDFPTTLCCGLIRTHGRVSPDWTVERTLYRLSYSAAALKWRKNWQTEFLCAAKSVSCEAFLANAFELLLLRVEPAFGIRVGAFLARLLLLIWNQWPGFKPKNFIYHREIKLLTKLNTVLLTFKQI